MEIYDHYFTLKVDGKRFSETLVSYHITTRRHEISRPWLGSWLSLHDI